MPKGNPFGYKKFGDPKSGVKKGAKGKPDEKMPPFFAKKKKKKAKGKKKGKK